MYYNSLLCLPSSSLMVNVAIIPSMVNGWALSTSAIPIDVFLLVFSKPRSMGVQCGVRLDTNNNNDITGSQASQKKTTMTSFFCIPTLFVSCWGGTMQYFLAVLFLAAMLLSSTPSQQMGTMNRPTRT